MGALTPRRLARAANGRTNYVLLAAYLWHPMPWMSRVAAANPSTPRWARRLASRRKNLLDITLSRPDTSPRVLDAHARDPLLPASLLSLIAMNPASTPDTLERVAKHANTSASMLTQIVANPSAPPALAEDVVMFAYSVYGADVSTALRIYEAAVVREDLPSPALSWLAHQCRDGGILEKVARHPNTPEADAVAAALASRGMAQQAFG